MQGHGHEDPMWGDEGREVVMEDAPEGRGPPRLVPVLQPLNQLADAARVGRGGPAVDARELPAEPGHAATGGTLGAPGRRSASSAAPDPGVVRPGPREMNGSHGASIGPAPVIVAWSVTFGPTSSADAQQLAHGELVRGRERILIELRAPHPLERVHVRFARLSLCDHALVKVEIDDVVIVGMAHEADELPHLHVDVEAMLHLAREGELVVFPALHAPARELPEEGQHGARAPLRDEVAPLSFDDGGHHSYRLVFLYHRRASDLS